MSDSVESTAKKLGLKVYRYDNNLNPATTVQNARLIVQNKPDVIIDYSGVASANAKVGKIFKDSGIPCIAVNVAIPGCAQFGFSQEDLGTKVGEAAAAAVKAKGWTSANTFLIDVWSPEFGEDVNSSQTHLYSTLAKALPGWKQVSPDSISLTTSALGSNAVFVDGKGTLQDSNSVVKQALQGIPQNRNVIVSVLNHNSALGAQQALTSTNRKNWMLLSTAPTADGVKQIETDPHWAMAGDYFFSAWPEFVIAMAYAVADGVTLPSLTVTPTQATTKDNVSTFYNADGTLKQLPALPAADSYLKPYLAKVGGPATS